MIAITGATGQLGKLVIKNLIQEGVKANEIIAIGRSEEKLKEFKAQGLETRIGDYNNTDSLKGIFKGANKVLIISGNEIGNRTPQHTNIINELKDAKPEFVAYTSLLKADSSTLSLAGEHLQTEEYLKASGLDYVFLRNGWYTENYTASLPMVIKYNAVVGAANDGRISAAPRNDYALAAAKILKGNKPTKKIYELAGDQSFTLTDYANAISELTGKEIKYNNVSEEEYKNILVGAGLPDGFAAMLAETESKLPSGQLYSDSKDLSELIGKNTENLLDTIKYSI